MGLFSGSRSAPPQRAMTMPDNWSQLTPGAALTDYATVDASGENALRSVAIGSSVDLICSLASELPVDVFRGEGSSRQKLATPSNLQDPGGDSNGLSDWLYALLYSWLYRGNMYGHVVGMTINGAPRQVALLHPDSVYPSTVGGRIVWMVNGRQLTDDEQRQFIHRRVSPLPGRVLGMSVVERHALQIGVSLAASKFGSQWFGDGAHPSGLLVNQSDISQEQAAVVKQRWLSLFRGTREPAVLGKGWEWKPLQVTPEESQFLETQRFTEAQCARMFGPAMAETLGYETGGSMTYANVVDRRSDLLTFTLNRWLTRAERLLTELLPAPQYARFNRDALLQSTTLARYQAHSVALADGWRTINEVREIEDLTPLAWGDERRDAQPTVPEAQRDQLTVLQPLVQPTPDVHNHYRTTNYVEQAPAPQVTNEFTMPQAPAPQVTNEFTMPDVRVEAPITVTTTTPEPTATRKTILRDDAGAIIGIEETRSE